MKKDSIILVAGGTGMVGSAIIRELKKSSFKKILYPSSSELNLKNQSDVKYYINEQKPDYVFNAAAKVGGIYANDIHSAEFIYDNIQIQNNLIHFSMKNNIKKFMFLGSSCIYPKNADQPIKETALLSDYLEETNEAYAIAKISGIKMLEHYQKCFGFDSVSIMPCNLYGNNDNYNLETSHVLPALIRKFIDARINKLDKVEVWGTGKVFREFMHVQDVAKAAIYFMEHKTKESLINIGWGKEISILELVNLISQKVGFEGKIIWNKSKKDGTFKKRMDISRMKNYGFAPSIKLNEGLDLTIQSYCKEHLNKSFGQI
tara:strand:+ start:17172 stop:18122 length:951 start_codon:yes stop_codon:yes gene_type:complete